MFNFHKDHKSLVWTAFLGFLILSSVIAIGPAYQMQAVEPLPNLEPLSKIEQQGLHLYISEGCVACHTQQVRNIEMDQMWGKRPSLASDFYYSKQRLDNLRQSPSLLGSERTGPDLTNVGLRQPSEDWHLLHLYNPRSVVSASIMPEYPWLFEKKKEEEIKPDEKVIPLGKEFFYNPGYKIVASEEALALVAYLQSLRQTAIGKEVQADFIPSIRKEDGIQKPISGETPSSLPNGQILYANTCAACHQQNGQGITGAFPSLMGSAIVNDEDPETLIRIILQGYDARSEYGLMPSFAMQLNDSEVAAIANHERTSWGNNASLIDAEKVTKIRAMILNEESK